MSEETAEEKIMKLKEMVAESSSIVFFGGAGVSTESGVPDFRSEDGLYHQKYPYPPEEMLSHTFFEEHTKEFFDFYRDKLLIRGVKPNITHYKLAALEREGKVKAVVTQNIDGLHTAAGSRCVYELHGSTLRNHCMKCGKKYGVEKIRDTEGIPVCDQCGGIVKPDVVLYEESLNQDTMEGAVRAIEQADMLIVGGTSLVVYPAAGLINYFHGRYLVLINKQPTPYDSRADLCICDSLGKVFGQL